MKTPKSKSKSTHAAIEADQDAFDPDFAAFCAWLDDPDSDPSRYAWRADLGWYPAEQSKPKRAASKTLPPQQAASDKFLTLDEASQLIRTPSETIRYWIWQGRLEAFKPGRAVLVKESELLALVKSRETRQIRARKARKSR